MTYDFSGLSVNQKALLTYQGRHIGSKVPPVQPSERTVAKLIERGLVIVREAKDRAGPFAMTVKEYEVPLDVHAAWCAHCAKRKG